MKKLLATILCTVMLAGMLTGCTGSENTADTTTTTDTGTVSAQTEADADVGTQKEPYEATLVYIVSKDNAPGLKAVEEKLNELTQAELNITVKLMPFSYGTFSEQVQLMLAAYEEIDIVPIGSGSASTYIAGDYLVNAADYLNDYGQDIIDICYVGDFLWGIPNMKERYSPLGIVMRTDILEECGIDASKIHTFSDLTDVFASVLAAHPEMVICGGATPMADNLNDVDVLGDRYGILEDLGQSATVTNYYESDYYREVLELTREWYLAGYIMKDMATSKDSSETLMKAGNLFSYATLVKPNTEPEKENATGYDVTVVQLEQGVKRSSGTNGITYGIAGGSKDPARAMELLNWIYKTEEANDLLNWGVEGTDWVETEDGTLDYPEGVTADNCSYHQNYGWAQINQFNSHVWTGTPADIWDQYETFNNAGVASVAYGFMPDLTKYSNELSALKSVVDEYAKQLSTGAADPDKLLDEFNAKLYEAGLQTVMDAKQEQLDAWLAEKGK